MSLLYYSDPKFNLRNNGLFLEYKQRSICINEKSCFAINLRRYILTHHNMINRTQRMSGQPHGYEFDTMMNDAD